MTAFIAIAIIYGYMNNTNRSIEWLMIFPALLLLWTAAKHLRLRFTKLTIAGNKIRYEAGMLSKSTRTMELAKVQDVRVDQSFFQRMVGIGNISLETAGETSRLTMTDIDQPQLVADYILEAARNR
jgi:uncharacterized membrane protein YdbT with pleckstrin-like domain